MKCAAVAAAWLILAGCQEPPKQNRAALYLQGLEDLYRWNPSRGGTGDSAFDGMMGLDPNDSVPMLIRGLTDTTQTKIYDNIHDPPVVGDVCFSILLTIFGMTPKDFEREGVWVSKIDDNPIYNVKLDSLEIRRAVGAKFGRLAIERKWTGEPQ